MSSYEEILSECNKMCKPLTNAGGAPDEPADEDADEYFVPWLQAVLAWIQQEDPAGVAEDLPAGFRKYAHTIVCGLWGNLHGDGDDDFWCNLSNYGLGSSKKSKTLVKEIMAVLDGAMKEIEDDKDAMKFVTGKMEEEE